MAGLFFELKIIYYMPKSPLRKKARSQIHKHRQLKLK